MDYSSLTTKQFTPNCIYSQIEIQKLKYGFQLPQFWQLSDSNRDGRGVLLFADLQQSIEVNLCEVAGMTLFCTTFPGHPSSKSHRIPEYLWRYIRIYLKETAEIILILIPRFVSDFFALLSERYSSFLASIIFRPSILLETILKPITPRQLQITFH
jgi:hypothetical protein